ncbi:hypothetical protein [uncultured Draconibacterium sp.]|uniref:hypothetical protein n=1 Tax=uncultured Draconibacterium sp. TaxID=1573823 RepID=UPI0025D939A0|nr:hypothetical protein [uncultured Draconibacterium sp.]
MKKSTSIMNIENLHTFFQNAQNIGLFLVAVFAGIVWITGKSVEKSRNEQRLIDEGIAEKLSILAVDLDNSINQFSFVFEFSKDVNISEMIAEPSYLEIISPPKNGESKSILISIGVNTANFVINDNVPRIPFEIKSAINNGVLKLQNIQSNNQKGFELVLLPQFLDNPFSSIRDFNDCRVSPLLSDSMLDNLLKITMAVNSWPILECDIKNAYWRKENTNVLGVLINQNKPWSTDFQQNTIPYGLWKINLSKDLPDIAKSAYYHSIEMKKNK